MSETIPEMRGRPFRWELGVGLVWVVSYRYLGHRCELCGTSQVVGNTSTALDIRTT